MSVTLTLCDPSLQ